MKRILLISLLFCLLPVSGQHYVTGVNTRYFTYYPVGSPEVPYQRGKYEIYLNMSNYIGIRNVDTHLPLVRPVIYSAWRVNDTAFSTVDSVILKLKENILK